jgi:hypothetical protein
MDICSTAVQLAQPALAYGWPLALETAGPPAGCTLEFSFSWVCHQALVGCTVKGLEKTPSGSHLVLIWVVQDRQREGGGGGQVRALGSDDESSVG